MSAGVEQRLEAVDGRMGSLERRMESLEVRQLSTESSLVKVIDAVTEIVKVQEQHSRMLVELVETGHITGGRLYAVDARLGRIETQAGFVLD
jgi:hypothetical protein